MLFPQRLQRVPTWLRAGLRPADLKSLRFVVNSSPYRPGGWSSLSAQGLLSSLQCSSPTSRKTASFAEEQPELDWLEVTKPRLPPTPFQIGKPAAGGVEHQQHAE